MANPTQTATPAALAHEESRSKIMCKPLTVDQLRVRLRGPVTARQAMASTSPRNEGASHVKSAQGDRMALNISAVTKGAARALFRAGGARLGPCVIVDRLCAAWLAGWCWACSSSPGAGPAAIPAFDAGAGADAYE